MQHKQYKPENQGNFKGQRIVKLLKNPAKKPGGPL